MLRHPTTAQDNRILDRPHSFTLILPSSTCRRRFLFSRCRFLFTRWNTFALHYIRCKLESHDTDPLLRHSIKLDIGGVIMPLPLVASLLAAVSASLPDFVFFLSASIFLFLCPFVEIYGHTYKLQDTLGRTANTNHPALMLPETALRTAGFQGPGACSSSFLDLACFASRLVFGSKLLASWWPLGTCLSSLGSCSSSVGTVRPSWMKANIYGHTHTHKLQKTTQVDNLERTANANHPALAVKHEAHLERRTGSWDLVQQQHIPQTSPSSNEMVPPRCKNTLIDTWRYWAFAS